MTLYGNAGLPFVRQHPAATPWPPVALRPPQADGHDFRTRDRLESPQEPSAWALQEWDQFYGVDLRLLTLESSAGASPLTRLPIGDSAALLNHFDGIRPCGTVWAWG